MHTLMHIGISHLFFDILSGMLQPLYILKINLKVFNLMLQLVVIFTLGSSTAYFLFSLLQIKQSLDMFI